MVVGVARDDVGTDAGLGEDLADSCGQAYRLQRGMDLQGDPGRDELVRQVQPAGLLLGEDQGRSRSLQQPASGGRSGSITSYRVGGPPVAARLKARDHPVDVGGRPVLAELGLGFHTADDQLDPDDRTQLSGDEGRGGVVDRPRARAVRLMPVGQPADQRVYPVRSSWITSWP